MIISYDEYIQKIKEIEKLENKVLKQHHKICEMEKQNLENQEHLNHIIEIAYNKLQCKQKYNYDKKLHTNEVLKRILFHVNMVKK